MDEYHGWAVQREKGMAAWLAHAKGVPLPLEELRLLDRLGP